MSRLRQTRPLKWSGPHSRLEGPCGKRKTQVLAHVTNAVGARRVEVAVRAFGFNHEWRRRAAHDPAVTLWVSGVDEQLGVAREVQVAGREVHKLHRAVWPP